MLAGLLAGCGGGDGDGGADGGAPGVGGAPGGGRPPDDRSEYLRLEQDLAERYCAALAGCCTNPQIAAVQFASLFTASVLLDDEPPDVGGCTLALGRRFQDLHTWDRLVRGGAAIFDRDAYAACEAKVAALEACEGEAFHYVFECPVFAVGDGQEGEECGFVDLVDETPDEACAPGLWCSRDQRQTPQRQCKRLLSAGEACNDTVANRCLETTNCSSRGDVCVDRVPAGGDCNDGICAPGHRCETNPACGLDAPPDCVPRHCVSVDMACRGR